MGSSRTLVAAVAVFVLVGDAACGADALQPPPSLVTVPARFAVTVQRHSDYVVTYAGFQFPYDLTNMCTDSVEGSCRIRLCPPGLVLYGGMDETPLLIYPNYDGGLGNLPTSGTLMIEGLSTAVTMFPNDGVYERDSVSLPGFGPNDIVVRAMGAEIPTWSVTAPPPPDFTVHEPVPMTLISRRQPLHVRWTGGGDASMRIVLDSGSGHRIVQCDVPASRGSFDVPMETFATVEHRSVIRIAVTAGTTVTTMAGTWPITVEVRSNPRTANGWDAEMRTYQVID